MPEQFSTHLIFFNAQSLAKGENIGEKILQGQMNNLCFLPFKAAIDNTIEIIICVCVAVAVVSRDKLIFWDVAEEA